MKKAKFSYVAPKPVYGFRFFWKELTADGRLVPPTHHTPVPLLNSCGYESEEEAVADMEQAQADYDDFVGKFEFVLTRVYCRFWD
jgi:hypothetical protein